MRGSSLAVVAAVMAILLTATTGAGAADPLFATASTLVATGAKSLPGESSADIYGVGGGKVDGGLQKFDLSAHQGPNGDFGHLSVTFTNPLGSLIVSYSASVTCVHVHALAPGIYDRAWIKGVVKSVTPVPNLVGLNVGDAVDFGIKDGGEPSSAPADDFFAPNSEAIPAGLTCKAFYYTGELDNVTQGNVNIKGP